MKHKNWPIYIWFLDKDLQKSAEYMTGKALIRSIDGCIGALVSTYFYMIGIRTKKFYDYFFSKERAQETMDRFFPNWPLSKKPSFAPYNRRESKWCKMCYENWAFVRKYLDILLDEVAYRDGSEHENTMILNWLDFDMPHIDLPKAGISDVALPWKVIEPRFRRLDVIEGYRLQFMSMFADNDPFKAYGSCKRDIPEFVIDHFNSSQTFES